MLARMLTSQTEVVKVMFGGGGLSGGSNFARHKPSMTSAFQSGAASQRLMLRGDVLRLAFQRRLRGINSPIPE